MADTETEFSKLESLLGLRYEFGGGGSTPAKDMFFFNCVDENKYVLWRQMRPKNGWIVIAFMVREDEVERFKTQR